MLTSVNYLLFFEGLPFRPASAVITTALMVPTETCPGVFSSCSSDCNSQPVVELDAQIRFTASFKDQFTGLPVDPTEVILYLLHPDKTEAELLYSIGQFVRDDAGDYHYDLVVPSSGPWAYQWRGTGTANGVSKVHSFFANPTTLVQ